MVKKPPRDPGRMRPEPIEDLLVRLRGPKAPTEFGRRLQAILQELHLNQSQFAREIGLGERRDVINSWIKFGRIPLPSSEQIEAVCTYTGYTYDELIPSWSLSGPKTKWDIPTPQMVKNEHDDTWSVRLPRMPKDLANMVVDFYEKHKKDA